MTKFGSDAAIIREVASMKPDSITDAYALELHTRHMRAGNRRPATVRGRRGAVLRLADYLDPYGDRPRAVLDATSSDLVEWQASCSHLAAKTVSVYVGHLQVYYQWCVNPMRIIDESPAAQLLSPFVRRRLPRPIPEEDLAYALDVCTDPLIYAGLVCGAYAGLRSVDMSGLNRDDVITDEQLAKLRVRGKGDHEDLVIVGNEVIRALSPFIVGRRGPLFVDAAGRRRNPKQISKLINEYLARLGLPYTFHNLRHRYITRIYRLTRDIRFAQRQARHQSVASTEIYAEIPTDRAAKSVQQLDAELSARKPRRRTDLGA